MAYHIGDIHSTHGKRYQRYQQVKKWKKSINRSNSMFEWSSHEIHPLSPNTTMSTPRYSQRDQVGRYFTLPSSESQFYEYQIDSNINNENHLYELNEKDASLLTATRSGLIALQPQNRHDRHGSRGYGVDDNQKFSVYSTCSGSATQHQRTSMDYTSQYRQQFLTQFIEAFVSSGAPSHRLDHCTQLLLDKWQISAQIGYFPGFLVISFENVNGRILPTSPTTIQLIKLDTKLDIHRLTSIYQVFEDIMLDEVSVQQATHQLNHINLTPRLYRNWLVTIAYGVASSSSMPLFFYGGWLDMIFGFGIGMIVAVGSIYLSPRITRFAGIFDVLQCAIVGFLAAAAASRLPSSSACFYALSVGSVVTLLPGYVTLVSMLEIASNAVASGTLRLTTTLVYSLLLGFGLAIGASGHQLLFPRLTLISSHTYCEDTLSPWSHLLLVPFFAVANAIILGAPRTKFGIIILLAIVSHSTHYAALLYFVSYPHLATVLAAFVVALMANIYARLRPTVGFVDMITGLFFLVPGSVGVTSTLDTFGQALANAVASPSPSNTNAVSEMSVILNAGQQGILFAVHIMVITVSVSVGLVLAALVIYPVRMLLDWNWYHNGMSTSSTSFASPPSSASTTTSISSSPRPSKKRKYRKRDWIGEVTF